MERKKFLKGLFGIGLITTIPISLQGVKKESNIEVNTIIGNSIIQQILRQKQSYLNRHHYGFWKLYAPTASENILNKLFYHRYFIDPPEAYETTTILKKIQEIGGIKEVIISNKFHDYCFYLVPASINNMEDYLDYWIPKPKSYSLK